MNNNSYKQDSDYRVEFYYMPMYRRTAELMKSLMEDGNSLTPENIIEFKELLQKSTARNLRGHGYEALHGQIEALNIYMTAGVREFVVQYPHMCNDFTKMIKEIAKEYRTMVKEERFHGMWGEDYEKDIRRADDYFQHLNVFVYGTLQQGECNRGYMSDSTLLCRTEIEGFEMYDICGRFPGIVNGNGKVKGELYKTSTYNLTNLDRLEGEGSLYIRRCVKTVDESGNADFALVYVYNESIDGLEKIPYGFQPYTANWRNRETDYVWYVAYGSNMLERRLAYYIEGGFCPENGRAYYGCSDRTMPQKSVPVTIPYNMYYGNYDLGAWENSAVSFIDLTKPGETCGRAYLVTRQQLEEIHTAEGRGSNWYPEAIRLDDIDGMPAYTFGGYDDKKHETYDRVSDAYRAMLVGGMKETYPEMTEDEIAAYLRECGQR